MKIILRKDVGGVGQRGKIVDVSDGYALNFLIPNGLGEQATKQKIAEFDARAKEDAAVTAEQEKEWEVMAKKIHGQSVVVTARANAAGHLYQQLSSDLIATALQENYKIDIPPQAIMLNAPIKAIGETAAKIRFGKTTADFTVVVKEFVK